MKNTKTEAEIKNFIYNLNGWIDLELAGFQHLIHVKADNIEYGGANCEISQLKIGGKIAFYRSDLVDKIWNLKKCSLVSDGIQTVDGNGNLVKW